MEASAHTERAHQKLAAARAALLAQLASVRPDQWDLPVYADGDQWTIIDILRHLVSSESSMARLIEVIRDGGEGAPPDFDRDRFNHSRVRKAKGLNAQKLVAGLDESRAYALRVIDSLSHEDWAREGRHGNLEIVSIEQIVKIIGLHERTHALDIKAALAEANEAENA